MNPGDTVVLHPNPENPYFSGEWEFREQIGNVLLIRRPRAPQAYTYTIERADVLEVRPKQAPMPPDVSDVGI